MAVQAVAAGSTKIWLLLGEFPLRSLEFLQKSHD